MSKALHLLTFFLLIGGCPGLVLAQDAPQVRSIEEGFRGIPWGSDAEFMKSKGYLCSQSQASGKTTCNKPGDRKSLGNMDVKTITCDLTNGNFQAVLMTFDTTEAETALMSLKNSFGQPAKVEKFGKMLKVTWIKGKVTITQTSSTIEIRKHANEIQLPEKF